MKEENVFSHLNVCDGTTESSSPKRPSRTPTPLMQAPPSKPGKPQDRLPTFNYTLLKEAALRKKLQDLNIPSFGAKILLQRRHIEWVNLWNANCDSSRPRSRRELLADLDRWEKTLGGRSRDGGAGTEVSEVMKKDFDGAGWAKNHKSDFDELIANARRKRESQKTEGARNEGNAGSTSAPEVSLARTDGDHVSTPIPDAIPGPALEDIIPPENQPPPAPHPPEHIDRPVSPVPGFDLAGSMKEGAPGFDEHGRSTESRSTSMTFPNGQTGEDSQVWQAESKIRRMPMFEMPGDPVVDTEMNGIK